MLDMLRKYFNLKILVSALLLALLAFGAFMLILLGSKPDKRSPESVTAIVNLIPAATWTEALVVPTQAQVVTDTPSRPTSSADIQIGSYVQVSGTGGSGLRLRVDASLDAEVRLLGDESEVFEVKDGPRQAGGYTWWFLVGPYDESRRGWAVEDFLVVVQNP